MASFICLIRITLGCCCHCCSSKVIQFSGIHVSQLYIEVQRWFYQPAMVNDQRGIVFKFTEMTLASFFNNSLNGPGVSLWGNWSSWCIDILRRQLANVKGLGMRERRLSKYFGFNQRLLTPFVSIHYSIPYCPSIKSRALRSCKLHNIHFFSSCKCVLKYWLNDHCFFAKRNSICHQWFNSERGHLPKDGM